MRICRRKEIVGAIAHDKKIVAGTLHFVAATDIGATTTLTDVNEKESKAAVKAIGVDARVSSVVASRRVAGSACRAPYCRHLCDERLEADLQPIGGARDVAIVHHRSARRIA